MSIIYKLLPAIMFALFAGPLAAEVSVNDLAKVVAIQQSRIESLNGLKSNPWVICGNLNELANCVLPKYPLTHYEYAFVYNSPEPQPLICAQWNRGMRVVNKTPYMMGSDNPTVDQKMGGAMFYSGTDASDDPKAGACPAGTWRHRYWYNSNNSNDSVAILWGNGCLNLEIYCRVRR